MGSARTRPRAVKRPGRISARAKRSSRVHTCCVVAIVSISACLHASCHSRKSLYDDELCAFGGFHFSCGDIHSKHMLSHEHQFHVQQNPPLIPRFFTERSLP